MRNNCLQRVKNSNSNFKKNPSEIQKVVTDYFFELFKPTNQNGRLSDRELISRITDEENDKLMAEITPEKVRAAAFSMHPNKSSGLDELYPGFFQHFWNIVGGDVVRFC